MDDDDGRQLQLWVHDRQYTRCTWIDPAMPKPESTSCSDSDTLGDLNPLAARLFHGDVVSTATKIVRHSPVRAAAQLPGVLVLTGNRTYGRDRGGKRLLYRCVPDDQRLPHFLVPYELKHLGFSKRLVNKYVLFRCKTWGPLDPHPLGELTEVLGDVDHLESFYEYQLYSKSLHASIKDLTDQTRKRLAGDNAVESAIAEIRRKYDILEDLTANATDDGGAYIFTIDPPQSVDYDDGFSVHTDADGHDVVTVYIANVFVWLEQFQLWESFSNRVATIYLPDRFRRPMLPTILSDTLCSLQSRHTRFALAMEFRIEKKGSDKGDIPIAVRPPRMVAVRPAVNHAYESPALLSDPHYRRLHALTAACTSSAAAAVRNSRDVVTWWMIHTNTYLSQYMMSVKRDGIFRVGQVASAAGAGAGNSVSAADTEQTASLVETRPVPLPPGLSEDAAQVVLHWKHLMGQYVAYEYDGGTEATTRTDYTHIWLGRSSYMHMTSPIRRLVDLLNQMILFSDTLSPSARAFVAKWRGDLAYINTAMRSIRKVESTCQLIHLCTTRPEVLTTPHRGIVFDKSARSDGGGLSGCFDYMVYLEDLKVLVRMRSSTRSVDNYSRHDFQLYLFESEDKEKKKIRIGFAVANG
jgi:hypothetical protein